MIMSSILAGISIGIAGILFCLAPNATIGALLFSLGLLNVLLMKYHLVTGKFQYLGKDYTISDISEVLIGNAIGIFFVALFCWCFAPPAVMAAATTAATAKIAVPLLVTFGKAILCGYIMTVATRPNTPLWVSALGVFAFISTGLNHCIADLFFYNVSQINGWIMPLWTAFFGNMIGGVVGGITPPHHP